MTEPGVESGLDLVESMPHALIQREVGPFAFAISALRMDCRSLIHFSNKFAGIDSTIFPPRHTGASPPKPLAAAMQPFRDFDVPIHPISVKFVISQQRTRPSDIVSLPAPDGGRIAPADS